MMPQHSLDSQWPEHYFDNFGMWKGALLQRISSGLDLSAIKTVPPKSCFKVDNSNRTHLQTLQTGTSPFIQLYN